MGEEMFAAGWPNVLNVDFSQVCIDLCQEQWNAAHWEEVQAKIANDMAEETQKEREMMVAWKQRRHDSEAGKEGYAEAETKRVENKNIKRQEQLVEFENKMKTKIHEATAQRNKAESDFNLWKSAQPDGGQTAPGVLSPEAQGKKSEMNTVVEEIEKNVQKWEDKVRNMQVKAEAALEQSTIDLQQSIADHLDKEATRIDTAEREEKEAFAKWQQDRRDYDTKGEGLLKGLRYAMCDTTEDEECAAMLPNETFDLVIDKGTFDSVASSTAEMGGDGDGMTTTAEAIDAAAAAAIERAKQHPDPREAPPYHAFGKHVRNIWRVLKQGGVYLLLSTAKPAARVQKIKRVGHGLKATMEMWQSATHVRLEKMGTRVLNVLHKEDKHHWAYVFVKTARRDVLRIKAAPAPQAAVALVDLGLVEPEREESSDDSSEGDLVDSEDESSEEESVVSEAS